MATKAKLEAAELKVKQLKAALKLKEARSKAAELKKERANDTRRKILIGSFVLSQIKKNGIIPIRMTYENARFSEWLIRDDDKKLFTIDS